MPEDHNHKWKLIATGNQQGQPFNSYKCDCGARKYDKNGFITIFEKGRSEDEPKWFAQPNFGRIQH